MPVNYQQRRASEGLPPSTTPLVHNEISSEERILVYEDDLVVSDVVLGSSQSRKDMQAIQRSVRIAKCGHSLKDV